MLLVPPFYRQGNLTIYEVTCRPVSTGGGLNPSDLAPSPQPCPLPCQLGFRGSNAMECLAQGFAHTERSVTDRHPLAVLLVTKTPGAA